MNNDAAVDGAALIASINAGDAKDAYNRITMFREHMRDAESGIHYVVWISEPVNITAVHNALTTNLGISPRSLAIKRAMMSRTQKAVLLSQAIEISIKKVHKL